jgi:hypothetical protein
VGLRGTFADEPLQTAKLPSFRAEHFPASGPCPWLDLPDAPQRIAEKLSAGELTGEEAAACQYWADRGYIIIRGLIPHSILDNVWKAYEDAIARRRIQLPPESAGEGDPFPGRWLNPHKKVPALCQILKHTGLLRWNHVLTGHPPRTLQTIMSHKGSQQGVHSDSIHMTTYPLGYLTAAWIAFEDIHPDCGPLVYYPGSHRLPYVFSSDVGITETDFKKEGYGPYHAKYEPNVRRLIETHRLGPHYFHAKKGDVLIWHANLLHGGSPRVNLQLSRRSLVCHFFAKGSFVYHDLAASRSKSQYIGTCLLRDEKGRIRLSGLR